MKLLLKLIIFVILAFILGFLVTSEHGQVIMLFGNYRIDLTITTLIIIVLVLYLLFYYLTRFWINLNRLPNKLRKWRARHNLLQSRNYLNSAGVNYFEGKYGSAYKNAMSSINKEFSKDNKFIALMLAFKSACYMRNIEKQEKLLSNLDAYKEIKWQLAKLMALVEVQYLEQKYGACLDNLNKIINLDKRHIPAHRIMLKVYLKLNNYEKSFEVLNWLIKYDYLEKYKAENYKLRVFSGLFSQAVDIKELNNFYYKLETKDRQNMLLAKFYFDALIRLEQSESAIDLLAKFDNQELSFGLGESIIILAKKVSEERQIRRLLIICEKLLKNNLANPHLLLTMGILAYFSRLWGNARGYLDASIAIKPSIDGYLYLSFIAKATDNQDLLKYAEGMLIQNIHTLV